MIRVCSTHDVPFGEGRAAVVGSRRVAVFNTASGWYALDAVCPHRGGPLEDGLLLVPAQVNGKGPFVFAIDPDAQNSIVDKEVVQLSGARTGEGPQMPPEAGIGGR